MLSSVLRRAQGRNLLMQFLGLGRLPTGALFTGSKAISYIRSQGVGYRTQLMYADIRMLKGMTTLTGSYGDMESGDFPSVSKVIPMPDARSEKYDYVFRGKHHDPISGIDSEQYFTIRSSDTLSMETLHDESWERFSQVEQYNNIEWNTLELVQVREYTKRGRG